MSAVLTRPQPPRPRPNITGPPPSGLYSSTVIVVWVIDVNVSMSSRQVVLFCARRYANARPRLNERRSPSTVRSHVRSLFPVLWQQWLKWFCEAGRAHLTKKPGWRKPHTHSNCTNLALFRHKITLYRFNQGAHTIAGVLKWEQEA